MVMFHVPLIVEMVMLWGMRNVREEGLDVGMIVDV